MWVVVGGGRAGIASGGADRRHGEGGEGGGRVKELAPEVKTYVRHTNGCVTCKPTLKQMKQVFLKIICFTT